MRLAGSIVSDEQFRRVQDTVSVLENLVSDVVAVG